MMDDETAKEMRWPDAFKAYWKPLSEEDERTWHFLFKQANEANKAITETILVKAITALGEGQDFTRYPPKISAILNKAQVILGRESRATEQREQREANTAQVPARKTVRCLYCKDTGWFQCMFVTGRLGKKRFPRLERKAYEVSGERVEVCQLEEGFDRVNLPCVMCDSRKVDVYGDIGRMRAVQSKIRDWLLLLPDECIDKPDILKKRRTEVVTQTISENTSVSGSVLPSAEDISNMTLNEFGGEW